MDKRIHDMLKLIEEDGDSFAKKAELYFRRRPELINHVEETYKAYRALADRFDRISGELHKANQTIATAFPEQVQLALQGDDGGDFSKVITSIIPTKLHQQASDDSEGSAVNRKKVNINEEKAQEEIDRLQKEILVLQTEKEFVKTSYESSLARYMDIDRQINEMHENICSLQGSHDADSFVDGNDAKALMAATAIKSCEHTLVNLQAQAKRSSEETLIESERIKDAEMKIEMSKGKLDPMEQKRETNSPVADAADDRENDSRCELQSIYQKIKDHFELSPEITAGELVEKIDELVAKVISLDLVTSSQGAQLKMLRSETDELHNQLHVLEEEKTMLIADCNALTKRCQRAEEELQRVRQLEQNVQYGNSAIQSHINEACHSLGGILEELESPKHLNPKKSAGASQNTMAPLSRDSEEVVVNEKPQFYNSRESAEYSAPTEPENPTVNQVWLQLLLDGLDGKENILLDEYTNILRCYKDAKKQLCEIKKDRVHSVDMALEIKDLRRSNTLKDEEIRSLRRVLHSLKSQLVAVLPPEMVSSDLSIAGILGMEISEREEEKKLNDNTELLELSPLGEKFKSDIDKLLEENMDFWLRFSASFHQIQKFQGRLHELQGKNHVNSDITDNPGNDVADKKLGELSAEINVWLEKNEILMGELNRRFSSQPAELQDEALNMSRESSKVDKELQAGADHVDSLQANVGVILHNSSDASPVTSSTPNQPKASVPLRTFLFGPKLKKRSIFSRMNPAQNKQRNLSSKIFVA